MKEYLVKDCQVVYQEGVLSNKGNVYNRLILRVLNPFSGKFYDKVVFCNGVLEEELFKQNISVESAIEK